MKRLYLYKAGCTVLLSSIVFATAAYGQGRATPPIRLDRGVQPPNVKSPEILADGRGTFRVGAPNPQTVVT